MAADKVTFRIPGYHDTWFQATRESIIANTALLDAFDADADGEILLHGWSSKVFDFFMKLLQCDDYELDDFLDEFEAEVKDVWSIASFHKEYVRQAEEADDGTETREPRQITLRMREWFRRWWDDNGEGFRGADAAQLTTLVMPAFYIGDAQVFMSVTHDWFLHVSGKQAAKEHAAMPVDSDDGATGVLDTQHPLLGTFSCHPLAHEQSNFFTVSYSCPQAWPVRWEAMLQNISHELVQQNESVGANAKPTGKLAGARANMIGKIEDALPYDEERDGRPRGPGSKSTRCEDPEWCPMLKSAAYYKALQATGCWPVHSVEKDLSIHQILTKLAIKFDYVNYDDMQRMPDRVAARAKMLAPHGSDMTRRCRVCVDAAVKRRFNEKIRTLIKTLLDEKKTSITIKRHGKPVKRVEVDDSFAGLCLDCLTKTKFGCEDEDYWNHCLDFKYDHGCTVAHGQPTWYFSYLGRPGHMKQFQKEMKAQLQTRQRGGR